MSRKFTAARLLAATAVAGLALAGCASGADTAAPGSTGSGSSTAAAQTTQNDADVTFAQGMIPHHRQAVEMAELAAGRSENPEVLDLAARIGAAQGPEIETMTGWLQEWGAEVPAEGDMGDMGGMAGMGSGEGMGGMMTPEQMQGLEQATGAAFDRMFLEMMVGHHRSAVEMAQVELDEGADPEALALAQTIIDTQQAE
ncbi:DUF305 domain-containing protein, partial [Pseudonocardia sp. KRD-182]|uniref:DUF305 domain-containing protein n=1 Tax=Pseudonocardia oceani TaxID=2792013 RepID=UPI001C49CBC6